MPSERLPRARAPPVPNEPVPGAPRIRCEAWAWPHAPDEMRGTRHLGCGPLDDMRQGAGRRTGLGGGAAGVANDRRHDAGGAGAVMPRDVLGRGRGRLDELLARAVRHGRNPRDRLLDGETGDHRRERVDRIHRVAEIGEVVDRIHLVAFVGRDLRDDVRRLADQASAGDRQQGRDLADDRRHLFQDVAQPAEKLVGIVGLERLGDRVVDLVERILIAKVAQIARVTEIAKVFGAENVAEERVFSAQDVAKERVFVAEILAQVTHVEARVRLALGLGQILEQVIVRSVTHGLLLHSRWCAAAAQRSRMTISTGPLMTKPTRLNPPPLREEGSPRRSSVREMTVTGGRPARAA